MTKNKLLKTFMSAILIFCIAGCSSTNTSSNTSSNSSSEEVLRLDMNDYAEFEKITVLDLKEKMDNGETFIVYFGFETCPWCYYSVPVLHDVATVNGLNVMYIDTRANSEWKSNLDIDDYDIVVDLLGDYLDYDNDGIKHLYTPHVFFIKDGKVVLEHEGTVTDHNAHERAITDEEIETLKEIYQSGVDLMNE